MLFNRNTDKCIYRTSALKNTQQYSLDRVAHIHKINKIINIQKYDHLSVQCLYL